MSLSPAYALFSIFALYHMHFRHSSLSVKISFKIFSQWSLKLILIKKFHGLISWVPRNFLNICGSMDFHGTLATKPQVSWNSMELCPDPYDSRELFPYSRTLELFFPIKLELHGTFWRFHGIPWNLINLILKKYIYKNLIVIWLMIICYLA